MKTNILTIQVVLIPEQPSSYCWITFVPRNRGRTLGFTVSKTRTQIKL